MRAIPLFSVLLVVATVATATEPKPVELAEKEAVVNDKAKDVSPLPKLSVKDAAPYVKFSPSDIFVRPAGPNGREYTSAVRALEGKQVSIRGFMVRGQTTEPDIFFLCDHPVLTHASEDGVASDIPDEVVAVHVPHKDGFGTAWQPYAVTVFGTMELGGKYESDGVTSYVRIKVDHITVGTDLSLIDVRQPLDKRDVNLPPCCKHDHHEE